MDILGKIKDFGSGLLNSSPKVTKVETEELESELNEVEVTREFEPNQVSNIRLSIKKDEFSEMLEVMEKQFNRSLSFIQNPGTKVSYFYIESGACYGGVDKTFYKNKSDVLEEINLKEYRKRVIKEEVA